jgi:hypothetical protein
VAPSLQEDWIQGQGGSEQEFEEGGARIRGSEQESEAGGATSIFRGGRG